MPGPGLAKYFGMPVRGPASTPPAPSRVLEAEELPSSHKGRRPSGAAQDELLAVDADDLLQPVLAARRQGKNEAGPPKTGELTASSPKAPHPKAKAAAGRRRRSTGAAAQPEEVAEVNSLETLLADAFVEEEERVASQAAPTQKYDAAGLGAAALPEEAAAPAATSAREAPAAASRQKTVSSKQKAWLRTARPTSKKGAAAAPKAVPRKTAAATLKKSSPMKASSKRQPRKGAASKTTSKKEGIATPPKVSPMKVSPMKAAPKKGAAASPKKGVVAKKVKAMCKLMGWTKASPDKGVAVSPKKSPKKGAFAKKFKGKAKLQRRAAERARLRRAGVKKPQSSYSLWQSENRARIQAELGIDDFAALSKAVGERWAKLTAEEKAPYEERAKEFSAGYAEAKAAYYKEKETVTTPKKASPVKASPEKGGAASPRKGAVAKFKGKAKPSRGRTAEWGRLRRAGLKPPRTSYTLWASENRVRIQAELGSDDFAAVSKAVGERWATLTAEEKAPYEKRAKELSAGYEEAKATYKEYFEKVEALKKAQEQSKKQRRRARPGSAAPQTPTKKARGAAEA